MVLDFIRLAFEKDQMINKMKIYYNKSNSSDINFDILAIVLTIQRANRVRITSFQSRVTFFGEYWEKVKNEVTKCLMLSKKSQKRA